MQTTFPPITRAISEEEYSPTSVIALDEDTLCDGRRDVEGSP